MKSIKSYKPKKSSRFQIGTIAPFAAILPALLSVVVCLVFWAHFWQSADHTRADSIDLVGFRAKELALAETAKAEAMILSIDLALIQIREQTSLGRDAKNAAIALIKNFPNGSLFQIAVIDAEGFLAWSSLSTHPEAAASPRIQLGDRIHYTVHKTRRDDSLFISEPVLGRASHQWSIQFSRRIDAGVYRGGVIVASVSPSYFSSTEINLDQKSKNISALFLNNGAYLSRSKDIETALGLHAPKARPFITEQAEKKGLYRTKSPIDGVQRSYAWSRGHRYPIVTIVGIDEAHALSAIEEALERSTTRAQAWTATVLCVSLLLSLFIYKLTKSRASLEESEHRYHALFDGSIAIKLLIDPESGRILDANSAAAQYYGYSADNL